MNRLLTFLFFINMSWGFSQSLNKTPKNSILFSPTVNFDWSTALKTKKTTSNLITGLNINYQRQDKLNNYHNVGVIIGVIPMSTTNAKTTTNNPLKAKQIGVQYNYKIVFAKFKNNSVQFYTAVGTQLVYRKMQNINYNPHYTNNSFIHNFVVTPGFQYTKNNFFIDFSLPASVGYNITNQKSYYPMFDTNQEPAIQSSTQKSKLLNWNVGFNAGVGAKF